jgi:methanogenic corrinoid protein MtbC1
MAGQPNLVEQFEQALLAVDPLEAERLLTAASRAVLPMQLVDEVIAPALERIGEKWEHGEAALSQVYMGGRICESLVDKLLPPGSPARLQRPKLAIAVLEDFHFLGKNLVKSALRASGFDPLDWGHATVEELVHRVRAEGIEVLLISTLMLPSALKIKELRAQLGAAGLPVKLVVGGAPFRFDPLLWREVGADACGQNALEAIEIVRGLLKSVERGRAKP